MDKRTPIVAALIILAFCAANVQAEIPSSKGSAAVGTATVITQSDTSDVTATAAETWEPVLRTVIQVAQQKELAFDVALQCGLYTDTLVKSKGGNKDTSTAKAGIDVRVQLQRLNNDGTADGAPFFAYPEAVTYAEREQQLMAKFQGIFQECETYADVSDPVTGEVRTECIDYGENTCLDVTAVELADGTIDYVTTLDESCLDYEELQLMLNTVSANAFNFVSDDLEQGEYEIVVQAKISSSSSAEAGSAAAKGVIGLGSMLVDEVRFIKADTDPVDTGM